MPADNFWTFLALYAFFSIIDLRLYAKTIHKPSISWDEWRTNGPIRFIPGSGFYLAWKYRNR